MTPIFLFWLLISHFIGDYVLQSHWMATEKTTKWWPAIAHGLAYSLPFAILLIITFGVTWQVALALLIIGGTHAIIDHYRLAKHLGWLKNQIGPKRTRPEFGEAMENGGYNAATPIWLSSWLMFITDNTLHVVINFLAVFWLFL